MTPDEVLFPILKSADWSGHEKAIAHKLSVPSDDPRLPWVTYGTMNGADFALLAVEETEGGTVGEDVKIAALRNLQDRPADWQPAPGSEAESGNTSMLLCAADELATERILDPEFMREAEGMLGTEILAVGIPRRGHMVAMDGRQPDASLTRFGAYNLGQFYSRESEPITSLTILMEEGEFSGLLQFTS